MTPLDVAAYPTSLRLGLYPRQRMGDMLIAAGVEGHDRWWQAFARASWERAPLTVRGPVVRPLPDESHLFDTTLRAVRSPLYRPRSAADVLVRQLARPPAARRRHVGVRFMIESGGLARRAAWALASAVRPALLPEKSDGDFTGYHARIDEMLNPRWRRRLGLPLRRYALIVNNPEAVDVGLWEWANEFLRGLYAEVGMNVGGNYFALFIGNYLRTPFGVHSDPESVFSFPVVGRKTMRTWPSTYASMHPSLHRAQHYRTHLAASSEHAAGPGGFVYWPSDSWHIAEGDGELSVSLALGLTLPVDGVSPATAAHRPDGSFAGSAPAGVRPLEGLTAEEQWLAMSTSAGCLYPPELDDLQLPDAGSLVRCGLVAHRLGRDGMLAVAANGHIVHTARVDQTREVLGRLSRGAAIDAGALRSANDPASVEVARVVRHLLRARAVKPASNGESQQASRQ